MTDHWIPPLLEAYSRARTARAAWETLWRDCYVYALPLQDSFTAPSSRTTAQIYDGTAMDAVDQLASSLLAQLTPPWSDWFGLVPGPDVSADDAQNLAPVLEQAARIMQSHFDRSNFVVEMHQAYLDLVTAGTAALLFEESTPGQLSAFRFAAQPLNSVVLDEGAGTGRLETVYRTADMTLAALRARFPRADLPQHIVRDGMAEPLRTFPVLEAAIPQAGRTGIDYHVILMSGGSEGQALQSSHLQASPYIAFRWGKAAGDIYGRSPIMKALPDIKTVNKVVELTLKNASIAVAGIWQADDDGVLNPANIKLIPGSIIPKAVGSQGLKALEMPGRFDVSQLVLDDLRSRIRHALLVDRMGALSDRRMTATEVIERSSEMALLLGATYGRLQSELLVPLIQRGYAILRRRGEVPDLAIDGRTVQLDFRSPIARAQGQRNIQNTVSWISTTLGMGAEAAQTINIPEAARFLGSALGVPAYLIRQQEQKETR